MIADLVGGVLLRQVPAALALGVRTGDYRVYGSIIKSVADGRIIGHLQEAGGLVGLAGTGPLAPLKLLADGVQIAQNEQINSGIQHLQAGMDALQSLGVANLALGAAGIGISVVGFAILNRKVDAVRGGVTALGARIDVVGTKVDALRRDLIEADLVRLRSLAEAMDEGWRLGTTAAERQWHGVAEDALYLANAFEHRGGRLLLDGPGALAEAEPMLDALSLVSSLHVAARAASGEARAAEAAAGKGARSIEGLTGGLGLADVARERVREWGAVPGTTDWGHALERAAEEARPAVRRLREREAAAATRGEPLRELARRGVLARDWMEAAREEKDAPVLLLPATA